MGLRHNPKVGIRLWLTVAMLAAAITGARAQAPESGNESKILHCREHIDEIMWLDREALRARCGIWTRTYTVKTKKGEVERIVYSRYFVVTLSNGVVSSVRQRRQIFTGFKKQR
jgi:hypothetical protein